jgi:hypothetical protein
LVDGRLDELTAGMRSLTVLFAFVGEVDNGGFEACMYNSTGDFTADAIAAAEQVGLSGHAAIFRRFVDVGLGGRTNLTHEQREARLEAMTDEEESALEELGDEFGELPSIEPALHRYIERHPDEFFTD